MLLACITLHQLYYITSSLHHLDALHHLTSEYTHRANPMYYTRCHMYYMRFTFTDVRKQQQKPRLKKMQQFQLWFTIKLKKRKNRLRCTLQDASRIKPHFRVSPITLQVALLRPTA